MDLKVVGAGVGRTGTSSLKSALERLLGVRCYHMVEVFQHPEHVPVWSSALQGDAVDWEPVLGDFGATVDWPAAELWRELLAANPDAYVLLSTRRSTDEWWRSARNTIFDIDEQGAPELASWYQMAIPMMKRFAPDWPDEASCRAAYERHNEIVRAEVPADRLIDWQPHDGWGPICSKLGVDVPQDPFPLTNTTNEFRARSGKDPI